MARVLAKTSRARAVRARSEAMGDTMQGAVVMTLRGDVDTQMLLFQVVLREANHLRYFHDLFIKLVNGKLLPSWRL